MIIISKKKLSFNFGGQTFDVKPLEMASAPEWIKNDPLFGWALSDGTITITGGKDIDITADSPGEPALSEPKKLSQMTTKELEAKSLELNVDISSAKNNKERVALIEAVITADSPGE